MTAIQETQNTATKEILNEQPISASLPSYKSRKCDKRNLILVCSTIILVFGFLIYWQYYHQSTSGILNKSNIRGGRPVSGNNYPWIASWRFGERSCCTGSLINSDPAIILTAAHCQSCGNDKKMDLGRTSSIGNLNRIRDSSESESFNIIKTIIHPLFNTAQYPMSYDIMMVLLDGSTNKQSIPLPPPKISSRDPFPPGSAIGIAGYGQLDATDMIYPDQLHEATIYLWRKQECYNYILNNCDHQLLKQWHEYTMICGFESDSSNERGDSGGPGIIDGYLSGINSWSPPYSYCNDNNNNNDYYKVLDVFTDVGSLRHWIEDYKPSTKETYIIAIYICNETDASTTALIGVQLHGRSGDTKIHLLHNILLHPSYITQRGYFNVFSIDNIANIGWQIDGITFLMSGNDAICIDTTIVYRSDGNKLISGSNERIWLEANGNIGFQDKKTISLFNECGNSQWRNEQNKNKNNDFYQSNVNWNLYTLIIHICDNHTFDLINNGNLWIRIYGVLYTSEWILLNNHFIGKNNLLQSNGYYIFNINTKSGLGFNVNTIEFKIINGNKPLCIDNVVSGKAYYPYLWKGNNQNIYIQPNQIHSKLVTLFCYDY